MINRAKKLFNLIKDDADYVGLKLQKRAKSYSDIVNGNVENIGFNDDGGAMIEVIVDGYIGYAATSALDEHAIKLAASRAKNFALLQKENGIHQFKGKIRGSEKYEFKTSNNAFKSEQLPAIANLFKEQTTKAMKGANIVSSMAFLSFFDNEIIYLNTNGAEVHQNLDYFFSKQKVIGAKGELNLSRSLEEMSSGDQIDFSLKNPFESLVKQTNELLAADNCPEGKMDMILTPDQLYLQVHESIGHPLELDRILGDERNYAGWSFVGVEDFGTLQYGSELLNVTFDPTLPGELATYVADDTGIKAQKEYLIKGGKLLRGIGGAESQERSGVGGIMSQRATSWNRAPIDRMGNINIEAGTSTMDEMIKSTENGILMETNNSWSIDDYRNKFQFGCEYARLIKDGELKGVVRNPNYRGISVPFWNSLSMVGDQSTFQVYGSPYCGKGEPNQIINVGHAVPACKFINIDVFGADS